jgi:hypothetical protein
MKYRRALASVIYTVLVAWSASHHPPAGETSLAYVGPGAGFVLLGSLLSVVAGVVLSLASLLSWPFRMAWRAIRGQPGYKAPRSES